MLLGIGFDITWQIAWVCSDSNLAICPTLFFKFYKDASWFIMVVSIIWNQASD